MLPSSPFSWPPTLPSSSPTASSAWQDSLAYDHPVSLRHLWFSPGHSDPFALPTVLSARQLSWLLPMHSWCDACVWLLARAGLPWVDDHAEVPSGLTPQELQLLVRCE